MIPNSQEIAADWSLRVEAALGRYDGELLDGVATRLLKPRGTLPREEVLDRTIELTTKVVDYCLNQAMPNMKRFDTEDNGLFRYVRTTSIYRNNTYYGWKNRPRFEEKRYTPGDPKSWIRPRLILPNKTRDPALDIDYRVYRRSMDPNVHHHSPRSNLTDPYAHGPANFNFFSWLTRIVEDLFDFAIGAETDAWFNAIQEFLVNPATEISDYPNVGLFYWVRFSFVCNFPENLNCSIGEGVETALLWTIVVLVGSIIIGAYVFPIITVPFQIFGYGLAALLIFMAIVFSAIKQRSFLPKISYTLIFLSFRLQNLLAVEARPSERRVLAAAHCQIVAPTGPKRKRKR